MGIFKKCILLGVLLLGVSFAPVALSAAPASTPDGSAQIEQVWHRGWGGGYWGGYRGYGWGYRPYYNYGYYGYPYYGYNYYYYPYYSGGAVLYF